MLYINKNRIFFAFLSYFSGPFFNGEEGPNLGIFEELKVFLGAHNHKTQFWNDSKYILQLIEALAGHTQHNRMSEKSLAQRLRCCRENAALAADPRHFLDRWSSDWSYDCGGTLSSLKPINENFPDEHIFTMCKEPWYADIANYLATGQTPSSWPGQDKHRFMTQIRFFFWDEPHLFKYCPDQIIRRCLP